MALLADNPADRAEQLILLSQRLAALIGEETRRIGAREASLGGAEAEEKGRLANAYRLELARIKHDHSLLAGTAPAQLEQLRSSTAALQHALIGHELALNAVKIIAEGLVQAMAEEVVRQRGAASGYGAGGALDPPSGPLPAMLDHTA